MTRPSLLALTLVLVACNTEAPAGAGSAPAGSLPNRSERAAAASAAAWAPPSSIPPEFTGPLTVERVTSARSVLHAPQSMPKVFPILLGTLGKPKKTIASTHPLLKKERNAYRWAAESGTTCATFFTIEQPNTLPNWPAFLAEDTGTGTFEMPKKLPTSTSDSALMSAWKKYAECRAVLDEDAGMPPDAPGAAGPGALVQKADIDAGLERAPGKWLGKTVTTEGTLFVSDASVTIDSGKGTVTARLKKGATAAPQDDKKKGRVRGKVADRRIEDDRSYDLVDAEVL